MRGVVSAGIVVGALSVLGACEPKSERPAPTTLPAMTTTASPPPTTQPAPATTLGSYVVVGGDTLSGIAHKFDVSLDELARQNGITDVNAIQVGQELKIPPPRSTTTAP